jgi:hypothetical protein
MDSQEKARADAARIDRLIQINTEVVQGSTEEAERARLEAQYGKGNVMDTDEVRKNFEVEGFMAPFCVVRRLSDGQRGSLEFQHLPRFYFNFVPDTGGGR